MDKPNLPPHDVHNIDHEGINDVMGNNKNVDGPNNNVMNTGTAEGDEVYDGDGDDDNKS